MMKMERKGGKTGEEQDKTQKDKLGQAKERQKRLAVTAVVTTP